VESPTENQSGAKARGEWGHLFCPFPLFWVWGASAPLTPMVVVLLQTPSLLAMLNS
jgi:hypothetical protein